MIVVLDDCVVELLCEKAVLVAAVLPGATVLAGPTASTFTLGRTSLVCTAVTPFWTLIPAQLAVALPGWPLTKVSNTAMSEPACT
jgi:hypothetical protein